MSTTSAYHSTLPWISAPTWDPSTPLPSFSELPQKFGLPCAWDVWGKGDNLGTINLLTPERVKEAGKEVRTGVYVSLNLPLQVPSTPAFGRQHPVVEVLARAGEERAARDTVVHMNDQSGTQWDGLRHFGLLNEGFFYGNTPATDIKGGELDVSDPLKVKAESVKLGIQHWSNHGINGRGILLDMVAWYTRDGSPLPYDPTKTSVIPLADLKACAEYQGVSFKVGDILLIRMGWTQRYYASSMEEKKQWGSQFGQEQYVGIENTTAMREWLWDNHFAAVASDVAALETWPCEEGKTHLHQTLIGMYGSPIGEFFDLERLAEVCAEQKRFTFLFTSNPLNSLGGASSLANAGAIF